MATKDTKLSQREQEQLDKEMGEHVLEEKSRIDRALGIREIVFGAQDGLLVPLGVVSSVAGAFSNNHIVIVAGVSEALAGAFSMGTGAFLSSQAERQVHMGEVEREIRAIKKNPVGEKEELVMLYQSDGLSRKDAETVVNALMTSDKAYSSAMVQKELGLDPEPPGTATRDAYLVGMSYLIASVIPLAPYFFLNTKQGLPASIGLTMLALFTIGLLKAKFAFLPYLKSGLQVLAIGSISGLGGYLLGTFLPRILGIG